MPSTTWCYRAAVRLGVALVPVLGLANAKMAEGHRRRRQAADRLAAWGASRRDHARPLVWFHASSVGEGRQAESALIELRRRVPLCQVVYTHFSPSAEPLARRLDVDVSDYLPYDRSGAVERVLSSLAPDLLVFVKLDLWPELATRAERRGTAVALVAATVSPGSGRLRRPVRDLLRPGYRAVTAAGAISEADAARLATLGVRPDRIVVTGDPRFDSVAARVAAVEPSDPLLAVGGAGPTLVAGSTWPHDEAVLLAAFARIGPRHPEARLILVPHEPTPEHLTALDRRAVASGLPMPERLSADRPAPLLVVDRVGALATLYGSGPMAYVGGGYGRSGLHSVLEPAAWGVPVAFGPRWRESRDAGLLLAAGAAEALPDDRRAGITRMAEIWERWLTDDARRREQGARGAAIVSEGKGAAGRSADILAELISSRRPRT